MTIIVNDFEIEEESSTTKYNGIILIESNGFEHGVEFTLICDENYIKVDYSKPSDISYEDWDNIKDEVEDAIKDKFIQMETTEQLKTFRVVIPYQHEFIVKAKDKKDALEVAHNSAGRIISSDDEEALIEEKE